MIIWLFCTRVDCVYYAPGLYYNEIVLVKEQPLIAAPFEYIAFIWIVYPVADYRVIIISCIM